MRSPFRNPTWTTGPGLSGLIPFLALAFLLSGPLQAQQQAPIEAVLDISTDKNKVVIQALCRNHTNQSQSLRYRLLSSRRDANNNQSSNSQSSDFEVAAGDEASLSSTTLNLGKKARVEVVLEIFDGESLVARQTYPATSREDRPGDDQ